VLLEPIARPVEDHLPVLQRFLETTTKNILETFLGRKAKTITWFPEVKTNAKFPDRLGK
jgi:hypothetical protein